MAWRWYPGGVSGPCMCELLLAWRGHSGDSSGSCRRERWTALLLLAWRGHSGDSSGPCRRERWMTLLLLAWRRHSGDSSGPCRREGWMTLLLLAWRRHSGDSSGPCRREGWMTLLLLAWRRHSGDSSGPCGGVMVDELAYMSACQLVAPCGATADGLVYVACAQQQALRRGLVSEVWVWGRGAWHGWAAEGLAYGCQVRQRPVTQPVNHPWWLSLWLLWPYSMPRNLPSSLLSLWGVQSHAGAASSYSSGLLAWYVLTCSFCSSVYISWPSDRPRGKRRTEPGQDRRRLGPSFISVYIKGVANQSAMAVIKHRVLPRTF